MVCIFYNIKHQQQNGRMTLTLAEALDQGRVTTWYPPRPNSLLEWINKCASWVMVCIFYNIKHQQQNGRMTLTLAKP